MDQLCGSVHGIADLNFICQHTRVALPRVIPAVPSPARHIKAANLLPETNLSSLVVADRRLCGRHRGWSGWRDVQPVSAIRANRHVNSVIPVIIVHHR